MTLLSPDFLDAVVALGFPDADEQINWSATGFFVGREYTRTEGDQKMYRLFLVTNRHVFEGSTTAKVRINPGAEGPAGEFDLDLVRGSGSPIWKSHPDDEIDVCVLPIAAGKLQKLGYRVGFFRVPEHVASLEKCVEIGLSEGDGAFVLGFPMGLVGKERSYVIARSGSIARIRDALSGDSKDFLIDTFIFPGNSGGPVVLRPDAISIVGTKPITESRVIGIVKGYVPYRDVAVSTQTGQARIIFEENSGLTSAHPISHVLEVLETGYPPEGDPVFESNASDER
jgi:S1-C subfamily serine protease